MNDDEYIMRNAKPTTLWTDFVTWYARIKASRPVFALDLMDDDLP